MASAFDFYLRTGRSLPHATKLETKFNPWHDPEDGRFTFAGQGRYFGRAAIRPNPAQRQGLAGRGGSFGGGGASGSWSEERSRSRDFGGRGGSGGGGGGATGSGSSSPPGRPAHPSSQGAKPRTAVPISRSKQTRNEPRLTIRKNS